MWYFCVFIYYIDILCKIWTLIFFIFAYHQVNTTILINRKFYLHKDFVTNGVKGSTMFLQELEKKKNDYLKNESSCKSEFLTQCKQLGIQGDKIKRELVDRLRELPDIYDKVCRYRILFTLN